VSRTRALVLGGGGVDSRGSDSHWVTLDELFARQLNPDGESGELAPPIDVANVATMFIEALWRATSPVGLRQAIGVAALATVTVEESARRAVIEHRLPRTRAEHRVDHATLHRISVVMISPVTRFRYRRWVAMLGSVTMKSLRPSPTIPTSSSSQSPMSNMLT